MKKIKYQGGLTKLITSRIGMSNKRKFATYVDLNLPELRRDIPGVSVQISLASFSSSKDFYDQILSILSFLRYVGEPVSWTVYSDGTHSTKQLQLLNESFEFLEVKRCDWDKVEKLPENTKEQLLPYKKHLLAFAKELVYGKKMFHFLNHKIDRTTIFLDADVLFYQKASMLESILREDVKGWYLPDPSWGCLDSRYLGQFREQPYQLNSGFFMLNEELVNIDEALGFLKSVGCKHEYFTEQTIFHILSRCNNLMPLDPRIFILNSNDQFDFSYVLPKEHMAIRHYTGPVRHKMWQKDWKWQLSLS